MSYLEEEVKASRLTRAKVSILGFVEKAGSGYRYLNATRFAVPWPTDEEFYSAIAALIADGLISETVGRDGGKKLNLAVTTKENKNG